jgi:protein MAK11
MKFLVAIGSYEKIVYGVDVEVDEQGSFSSKVAFAMTAHSGYIKSIACCPKYLVSGGTDEVLRIFDLRKRKDYGSINQHDGSIRAIDFFESTHMLSAAEDGKIALFRTRDWECLHLFQKYKKPIADLKIHPSGKLAVSLDDDKNLTLWNLVTGKLAHSSKVPALGKLDKIAWSETGKYYALLGETHLLVIETQTSKRVVDLRAETVLGKVRAEKWLSVCFYHDENLLFAGESGKLHMIKLDEPEEARMAVETGHKPRIRSISRHEGYIITASSDGKIKIFDFEHLNQAMKPFGGELQTVECIHEHSSELRITCMSVTSQ